MSKAIRLILGVWMWRDLLIWEIILEINCIGPRKDSVRFWKARTIQLAAVTTFIVRHANHNYNNTYHGVFIKYLGAKAYTKIKVNLMLFGGFVGRRFFCLVAKILGMKINSICLGCENGSRREYTTEK